MTENKVVIDNLVKDLKPVKNPPLRAQAWAWLIFNTVFVLTEYYSTGHFRKDFLSQLTTDVRFGLQFLVAFFMTLSAGFGAFELGIPNDSRSQVGKWFAPALFILLGVLMFGEVVAPAFMTSTEGHRAFCMLEIPLFAVLPGIVLIFLLKRTAPTEYLWMGIYVILACVGMPLTFMQVACKYDPVHSFAFHYLPVLLLIFIGPPLSRRFLRWR